MKSKIVYGMFGSLALLIALAWLAGPNNERSATAGAGGGLAASETKMNFGEASMKKGKVTRSFSIKNEGAEPVIVTKVYTSCMCTVASLITANGKEGPFGMPGHGIVPSISAAIAPGETAAVEVTFDPAAHGPAGIGTVERVITVETRNGGDLTLGFRAVVTP